jgi:hypothetical protein
MEFSCALISTIIVKLTEHLLTAASTHRNADSCQKVSVYVLLSSGTRLVPLVSPERNCTQQGLPSLALLVV